MSPALTEWFITALVSWGLPLLGIGTFLSCLALPVPTSLMMLMAGAFAASGDLQIGGVMLAAYIGALAGDQAGYQIARAAYGRLSPRIERGPKTREAMARARVLLDRRGTMAVFLSRWLVAPLGPYVNFAAGAARMRRSAFTLGSLTGEAIWVLAYVGLGYSFAASIETVAELASDFTGILAGLVLMTGFGFWIAQAVRRARRRPRRATARARRGRPTPAANQTQGDTAEGRPDDNAALHRNGG